MSNSFRVGTFTHVTNTRTTLLQHDSTQTKNQATTGCPLANNHADVVRRHEYAGKDYDTPANFRN